MSDEREESPERADRVERLVRELLAGRRLDVRPEDAPDRDVIMAAARLAGAREAYPRMSSAFRRKLAERLAAGRDSGRMSRRTALVAGLGAAVGALTGGALARIGGGLLPAPAGAPAAVPAVSYAGEPGMLVPRPGKWFDAGPLENLVEGRPVRFQAGALGSYLIRRGDSVVGMSSVCTHLPCELTWQGSKQEFLCPCHNVAFDLQGESQSPGYPLVPLPRLEVKVVAGRVQVLGA